jgi:hypothetical protein
MSADKLKKRETPLRSAAVLIAPTPVLTCGSVGSAATAAKSVHWKSGHKIGCKRKGRVDFALFNIRSIAKSLMPVDNERKHGGVAEPIRRHVTRDVNTEEKRKVFVNFAAFRWKKCAGRLLCLPRVLNFPFFDEYLRRV